MLCCRLVSTLIKGTVFVYFFKLLCLRSSYLGEAGHLNVFSDDIIPLNYCFMVVFNDLYYKDLPAITVEDRGVMVNQH